MRQYAAALETYWAAVEKCRAMAIMKMLACLCSPLSLTLYAPEQAIKYTHEQQLLVASGAAVKKLALNSV